MLSRPSPITLRNVCNWPPAWVRLGRAHARAAKTITGEIGVLKVVRCYEDRPGRIYLTVDHYRTAYERRPAETGREPAPIPDYGLLTELNTKHLCGFV